MAKATKSKTTPTWMYITEKIKSSFENMLGSIDKFGDRKFWNMAIYYFCIGAKFFVIIVRIRLTTAWLIR